MSISNADRRRLDVIHAMRCIACQSLDGFLCCGSVEAHHIVDRGYRRLNGAHSSTLPLGKWHHRGEPLPGYNERQMLGLFGPSFALSKKSFIQIFGTERELLARVGASIQSQREITCTN